MPYTTLPDGIRLYYEFTGPEDKPVILQFGGSLFAMTDPFWMIMMLRNLGPGYVVWDRAAEIDFVSPGRTAVTAEFVLDPAVVEEVRAAADAGERVVRWFGTDVVGTDGVVVARVRKQLYVRRAPER